MPYKCTKCSISHIIPSIVLSVSSMHKIIVSNIQELKNFAIFKTDKMIG